MKMRVISIGAMAIVAIVLISVASTVASQIENNRIDYQTEKSWIQNHTIVIESEETAKPQEKIEDEMEKASQEIQAAEEAVKQAEEIIDSLQYDPPNNAVVLLEEAIEHLTWANEAFEDERYGRAYGLANSAKKLAQNAIKNLEDYEPETDNEELEPVDDEPLIPNDEPNIITIWYMLASPYEVDPFVHTYILNTSGETLYDVDFRQLIPSDLQLADDFSGWVVVKRYNEERVEGTDSSTQSGTYLTNSTYSHTYKDGSSCTVTRSVSGDTLTVTRTYYSVDGQTSTNTYTRPATETWSTSYRAIWSGPTENRIYDDGYSYTTLNTRGREGTAHIAKTQTTTYGESSEPDKLEVSYTFEYTYVNDYLQRFYDYDWYSCSYDGTNLSVDKLGPMDMIYSLIRVIPAGEIDPNRDYGMATRVEVTAEDGKCYAISDSATWREPFSTFKAVGAPYLGTVTLGRGEFSQYQAMYWYPVIGGYVADERVELIGYVDLWPPDAFDLSTPVDGTCTSDNTPELSWHLANDRGFGISNYKLYVDNSLDKVIADNTQSSENASELTPGAHTWYVVAVDYAGNERRSTSARTINIENSAPMLDNNPMDNSTIDNTLTGENALLQDNITTNNLTTENSVAENITTADNSVTVDNTLVQEAIDNSTTDSTTTHDNTSGNSMTTDNGMVQDNITDISTSSSMTAQNNDTVDNSSTTNNTTVQESTTTSDTPVSDSSTSSTTTQDTTEAFTTSDAATIQDSTIEDSTTDSATTADITFSTDTSGPSTTTDNMISTSSIEETTSTAGDTSDTEETTSSTSPGNSAFGHSHKRRK